MKNKIVKSVIFIILLIIMFVINIKVFRTDTPIYTTITLLGSVLVLIYFPYKTFFK